ncbi:MAG: outer membrane protein assembly factor BamE [Aliishimia sp.]
MGKMQRRLQITIAILALVATSACVASFRNHGYIPPEDLLNDIVVGVDTRDSVADSVGAPSSVGVLNDGGFYYVRSRVRNYAYRSPEVVERQVLAISFDGDGVVTNVERFGLEDGRVITLERRVTETSVVDRTFLRQLMGSFGRIGPTGL